MKLHLGCGRDKIDGAVNIDIAPPPLSAADMVWDLNLIPWPILDDEVTEVWAQDVLEHLRDLPAIMRELYRVCQNGARIHIRVPNWAGDNHMQNPYHRTRFSDHTFKFFDKRNELYSSTAEASLGDVNFKLLLCQRCENDNELIRVELEVVQ